MDSRVRVRSYGSWREMGRLARRPTLAELACIPHVSRRVIIIVVLFSFSSTRPPPARLPSSGIIFSLFMSRPNETTRSIPMLMEYTHRCVGSQPGPVSHQAADELVEPHLEHLVTHAFAALVLDGREGVLDDCFWREIPRSVQLCSAAIALHSILSLRPLLPPPPRVKKTRKQIDSPYSTQRLM